MSYEKEELKFVNFQFGDHKILKYKINKKLKIKLKEHSNVHISGFKVISELEMLIYFTYSVNYGNIVLISLKGRCNMISFGGRIELIKQILKSNKNSELFKNNKAILDVIKDKIKSGCNNKMKDICEKNGIKFVNINISDKDKKDFKKTIFLDGDEDLI